MLDQPYHTIETVANTGEIGELRAASHDEMSKPGGPSTRASENGKDDGDR
jgi:hypothetical protein